MVYNVFESNECNSLDEIPTCPDCDSRDIATQWTDHHFQYGAGDSAVTLAATIPLRKCRDCGTEYLDAEAEELMHATVCHHLGVMTPAQVRAIRQQAGRLSRAEFSRITGLGEATIGRWERGELIQNTSHDRFLFLLSFPENLLRLRERLDRMGNEPVANPSATPQTRFRALRVTPDVRQRAETFVLATAGAA